MFSQALKNSTGYKRLEHYQSLDFAAMALQAVEHAVQENEYVILEYNRSQLYSGKYPENEDIYPEYTTYTKLLKKRKGQPFDRVTLKDTGGFYKRFFIRYYPGRFEITSSDLKRNMLVKKYKVRIFGVSEQNRKAFKPYVLESFKKILNRNN